jgi:hypothetical protein
VVFSCFVAVPLVIRLFSEKSKYVCFQCIEFVFLQYVVGNQLIALSQQNAKCSSLDTYIILRFITDYYVFQSKVHHNQEISTDMRRIMTSWSTTDRIYDTHSIRLYYNTTMLQLPTVFSTETCCTGF